MIQIPLEKALQIYDKWMERSRFKLIGDGSYLIAKRKWDSLTRDIQIYEETMLRLMSTAFEGDAEYVYDEVA